MKISMIGMGLMGGSLAMALRGWRQATIVGVNRSEGAIREALDREIIDEGYVLCEQTAQKALSYSDLAVICLHPRATLDFLRDYGRFAKAGSVWSDVVGVKKSVIAYARKILPVSVDFVGAHPMAGRELSGFDAAVPTLFHGCNYVLAPVPGNKRESVDLLRDMALYAGAGRITIAEPERHDRMIAYTSQMAHVLAAAIVQNPLLLESRGFEGGSFRDVTRVATLNESMWSELFVLNKDALSEVLRQLEGDVAALRGLIESGNEAILKETLSAATKRKQGWKDADKALID